MAVSRYPRFTRAQLGLLFSSALTFLLVPWYFVEQKTDGRAAFQPVGSALGFAGVYAYEHGDFAVADKILKVALASHIGDRSMDAGYAYFASYAASNLRQLRPIEALALDLEDLTIKTRVYGENYLPTVDAMFLTAMDLSRLGRTPEALPLAERVLRLEHSLSVDSFRLGYTHSLLADIYLNLGRVKESEEVAKRAISIDGENHPGGFVTQMTLETLAYNSFRRGRYDDSEALLLEAHKIQARGGSPISRMAPSEVTLRIIRARLGKATIADKVSANEIATAKLAVGSADLITDNSSARTLATLLMEQGNLSDAECLLRLELAREVRCLGPLAPSTLFTQQRLAEVLFKEDNMEEAESLAEETLKQREIVLDKSSSDIATTLDLLGQIDHSIGNRRCGAYCYARAVNIRTATLGGNEPITIETRARQNNPYNWPIHLMRIAF